MLLRNVNYAISNLINNSKNTILSGRLDGISANEKLETQPYPMEGT